MQELTKDQHGILLAALAKWGPESQVGMANEELGELITAINQFRRGRISPMELASEIADAHIMLHQLEIMFSLEPDISEQVKLKMERLEGRVFGPKIKE